MKTIVESIIGRKGIQKKSGAIWDMLPPSFNQHVITTHDINHLVYIFTMHTDYLFGKKTHTNIFHAINDTIRLFQHSAYLYPTAACAEKDYLYVLDAVNVNLNIIRDGQIAGSWTKTIQRLEDWDEVTSKLKKMSRKLLDFDLSNVKDIAYRYCFDNKVQPMTLEMINIDINI